MSKLVNKVNIKEPIDPDKLKIEKDDSFPMAYAFYIELDSKPSSDWRRFFEYEWSTSLYLQKREVIVLGDRLRVITAPNEIEGKIDWVKGLVEVTNIRVNKYNEEMKRREEREKIEKKRQEETIEKMRGRLKKK